MQHLFFRLSLVSVSLLLLVACEVKSDGPSAPDLPVDASVDLDNGMADAGAADMGDPDTGPLPCELDPDCEPEPEFDFAEFDATLESILADYALPGATAAVVHRDHGIMHLRGFGEYDQDRVFLLASSSKYISGSVVMRLHDLGTLDVTAPIRSYMPTEPWAWWARGPLDFLRQDFSVEQTMSHLAGIAGLSSPTVLLSLCAAVGGPITLQQCGRDIYNIMPQEGPPGEYHRYGGPQWQVAGAIAEHRSGRSWGELVDETFEQCDMGTLGYTNLGLVETFEGFVAAISGEGVDYPDDWQYDPNNPPNVSNPSIEGGAYADVRSLASINLMLLRGGMCQNGRVLSEASVQNMQTDRRLDGDTISAIPRDLGYGLGLYVLRDEPGGPVWLSPGAYASAPWMDVERGFGVVVLLESTVDGGPLFEVISQLGAVLRDMFDPSDAP